LTDNTIKRPLLKALIISLIPIVFMLVAGAIIYLTQIELYTSILFVLIHASCVGTSIIIGIIIVRKFKWNFGDIGIKKIEKNTLKNVFYLIPFFLIEILPLFTGFRDNDTNVNTFWILLLLALHFIIVGIHEEFYFRGIILSLFKENIKKAIIISSILFGMIHISNLIHIFLTEIIFSEFLLSTFLQIIYAFIAGIVYAEIVVITKSILPVILFHTIGNFISAISNGSILIGVIQWLLLLIFAIIMWVKIFKKSPNCT
jgi:membrane protease YdiL (CAAX protease family)